MKVAVLLDIHGNGVALKYAIRDFKELGISKIEIVNEPLFRGGSLNGLQWRESYNLSQEYYMELRNKYSL